MLSTRKEKQNVKSIKSDIMNALTLKKNAYLTTQKIKK